MVKVFKVEDLAIFPGWETRKMILEELKAGSKSTNDLARKLELNYSSVRYHLELMQKFRLVKAIKVRGKWYFELTKEGNTFLLNENNHFIIKNRKA